MLCLSKTPCLRRQVCVTLNLCISSPAEDVLNKRDQSEKLTYINSSVIKTTSYFCTWFVSHNMFKQLIAILFFSGFLLQSFNQAFIVGDYYANTGAYAQNCINKARPAMHCNGKCQMMKKLKQEEKKDQQNPQRRNSKEDVLSSKSFFAVIQTTLGNPDAYYSVYHAGAPVDRSIDFFHPPGIPGLSS